MVRRKREKEKNEREKREREGVKEKEKDGGKDLGRKGEISAMDRVFLPSYIMYHKVIPTPRSVWRQDIQDRRRTYPEFPAPSLPRLGSGSSSLSDFSRFVISLVIRETVS